MKSLLPLLPTLTLLAGCASIVSGTQQTVKVETSPTGHAQCSLTNSKGTWSLEQTPGPVTIHRAWGPVTVSCSKKDLTGLVNAESHVRPIFFGNLIFGGIILGMGIDSYTGAGFDYPETITVPIAPSAD